MERCEYLVMYETPGEDGICWTSDRYGDLGDNLEDVLNNLGEAGWELVSAFHTARMPAERLGPDAEVDIYETRFVLKRWTLSPDLRRIALSYPDEDSRS